MNSTTSRVGWTTMVVLAAVALVLAILDSTGNVDAAFAFLRNPLMVMLGWTSGQADNVADALAGPRDLQTAQQEIERLQTIIAAQEREIEELREVQGELQLFQDLFNRAAETPEYQRVAASVIGRDTNPLLRSLIIDKGSNDGILVGMPVESARGLVGQVYQTTATSSLVLLITDNASSVPARLGSTRATGNAQGGGLGGLMTMEWISLEAQVTPGEVVLTSGLGGKFPQDVVIGRILEAERREADLFQTAVVQPAVDFTALEVVMVITQFPSVDTSAFENAPIIEP